MTVPQQHKKVISVETLLLWYRRPPSFDPLLQWRSCLKRHLPRKTRSYLYFCPSHALSTANTQRTAGARLLCGSRGKLGQFLDGVPIAHRSRRRELGVEILIGKFGFCDTVLE